MGQGRLGFCIPAVCQALGHPRMQRRSLAPWDEAHQGDASSWERSPKQGTPAGPRARREPAAHPLRWGSGWWVSEAATQPERAGLVGVEEAIPGCGKESGRCVEGISGGQRGEAGAQQQQGKARQEIQILHQWGGRGAKHSFCKHILSIFQEEWGSSYIGREIT